MKKLLIALVALMMLSTSASAYYCESDSTYQNFYGWGASNNLWDAKAIAVNNCRLITPIGYSCGNPFCL